MLGVFPLCCLFKACALSQNGNGHSGILRHLHTYSCIHPNGGIVGALWECEPFRYQQESAFQNTANMEFGETQPIKTLLNTGPGGMAAPQDGI